MAKKRIERYRHRSPIQIIFIWAGKLFIISFIFLELLTSLIISTTRTGSRAMYPTLVPGQIAGIAKIPYGWSLPFTGIALPDVSRPNYGDLVQVTLEHSDKRHIPLVSDLIDFLTFNENIPGTGAVDWEAGEVIRRVIALPGDTVYISGGRAFIQVGGEGDFLEEQILSDVSYQLALPKQEFTRPDIFKNYYTLSVTVPEDSVFLLPDNRSEALGSQDFGFIPFRNLKGRVIHSVRNNGQDP